MDLVSEFGLLPKLLLLKVTETLFGVTIIVVEKFTVRFGFRLLFWTTPVWGETFPVIETGQIGNTFWRQGGKITQVLKYLIKQTNKTPLYFRLFIRLQSFSLNWPIFKEEEKVLWFVSKCAWLCMKLICQYCHCLHLTKIKTLIRKFDVGGILWKISSFSISVWSDSSFIKLFKNQDQFGELGSNLHII